MAESNNSIAVISITYNDSFKFNEWCQWYEEYKDQIGLHIIVDNGSSKEYLTKVRSYFKNSVIIERGKNGGCTGAYNDGLKYALSISHIKAIALLGNDIRLNKCFFDELYKLLFSRDELGMVGAAVLSKDSDVIESYGDTVNSIGIPKTNYTHHKLDDVPQEMDVSFVGGGCNLAKREFYEKVGLQDENLFMYNDEMDMFYRAKSMGYKEAVTKRAVAWHQHIRNSEDEEMSIKMAFLNGRNRIYIIKKHMDIFRGAAMFIYMFVCETLVFVRDINDKVSRDRYFSKCKGFIAGMIGNMDNTFLE